MGLNRNVKLKVKLLLIQNLLFILNLIDNYYNYIEWNQYNKLN